MWRTAIANHKILNKERNDPGYWSQNIIDATECLKLPNDYAHFYAYLCQSPSAFNIKNPIIGKTLGDLDFIPDVPPYPDNQYIEVFENGTDRTILVKNRPETNSCKDDEKTE